jgi:hypothetical protein
MSWLLACSLLLALPSPLQAEADSSAHRLVDVTGDGLLDQLSFAGDGSVSVSVNVGSKTFVPVHQDLPKVSVTDLLVSDLDGDGLLDLYLVSPRDNVALLGDGTGRFRDATKPLGLADAGLGKSAERVDVDGDGLGDLLLHNVGDDVLFWATGPGRYERSTPESAAIDPVAALAETDAELLALMLATVLGEQGGTGGTSVLTVGPGAGGMTLGGRPGIDGPGPTDDKYVNDDGNEVDSADIVDGSLTGADVSTSSGNVTFAGATVTADKAVFGVGSTAAGLWATVGGGKDNTASSTATTVGGGRRNTASYFDATVGGGKDNTASASRATIGGGYYNTASGPYATVGGGSYNTASGPYATVGGGGGLLTFSWAGLPYPYTYMKLTPNVASATGATVGGGGYNRATGAMSTVGGGIGNLVTGKGSTVGGGGGYEFNIPYGGPGGSISFNPNVVWGAYSTVSGGAGNWVYGNFSTIGGGGKPVDGDFYYDANIAYGDYSTVSGGMGNRVGDFSTVGGGRRNTATGKHAAIPGGRDNAATGDFSFAAGRRSKADHDGAFVWGDSFDADKTSSAPDEFNVYASGGARIFSNTTATSGVLLAPGGNSWSAVSDRSVKEHLEPVDTRAVLDAVASLPITTWNYKSQDDAVRHMGPMAQDFHAAFGLGVSDKLIDTIDPDGVALAAIQGLKAEKDEEITRLRAELEALKAQLAELLRR